MQWTVSIIGLAALGAASGCAWTIGCWRIFRGMPKAHRLGSLVSISTSVLLVAAPVVLVETRISQASKALLYPYVVGWFASVIVTSICGLTFQRPDVSSENGARNRL